MNGESSTNQRQKEQGEFMPNTNFSYLRFRSETDVGDTGGWTTRSFEENDQTTCAVATDYNINTDDWHYHTAPVMDTEPVVVANVHPPRHRVAAMAPQWGRIRYTLNADWWKEEHEALEDIEHKADWEV